MSFGVCSIDELNSNIDVRISSLQSLTDKMTTLKSPKTYPIYLSAAAMNEILGISNNVSGRGFVTIQTKQICDLFVIAGIIPPTTYALRIENGAVRSDAVYTYTIAKKN